ncbi:MAG TPA: leucine-rich repeat domain-containing protein [Kofleriaceae bacterium]|nr:leucine-rich repeat domain-containing protein [Kofleriaceae bacterium]
MPPRIARFFETERASYEGVRAWGLPGFSSDTKLKVKWGSPRLDMIHEYATDGHFGADTATRFLPIAALGTESYMFAVDVTSPSLAVHFFDYESGFSEWAPDFESFLGKLLRKGAKTPGEQLVAAYERAMELNADKQHAEVLALLVPAVAQFPAKLDAWDDVREVLGACHNLIGIAHENLDDIVAAQQSYALAESLGVDSAALNVCDLYLNHFKDYGKLVEYAEAKRENIYAFSDKYAWFHIRNYLGQAYLLTGKPALAIRAYHQILDGIGNEDPAKLAEAITDLKALLEDRPEVDRDTARAILAWLETPPPALPADRLATLRAWWPSVPEAAQAKLRETVKLDEDATPEDGDLARIAALTQLDVSDCGLTDIAWVSVLDALEDLDAEDNALVDITAIGKLARLTRLDISNNQVTSLRPLASLVRLERLSCGENPLAGLDGLEALRELSYLHVNEAGLTTIEPLRGLPELSEVTIYNNQIQDVSPLADSPRIKEISSFGNPLRRGLDALARLARLEKVDAGDDTPRADIAKLRAANAIVRIDHVGGDTDEPPRTVDRGELRTWWNGLSAVWRDALGKELDRDEQAKPEPSDDALVELVHEDSLHLDDRPLPDLVPLRRFQHTDYLNVGNTGITDLSPIARLPRLRDLIARKNPITSLAVLGESTTLEELYVEACRITSLDGLDGCATLRELYAEDNPIEDIAALAKLRELRVVDLEGNRVTRVDALRGLPHLRVVRLGLNQIADLSPLAECPALREVEIWANPGVRGARGLAECAQLVRVISHGSLPASELQYLREVRPDVRVD